MIWGTTYLGIRIALETLPPLLMAAIRWIVAGTALSVALVVRGERLPHRREWPAITLLGVLLLGFGNGAVVWAEQTVPSGLAAVFVAVNPFWMVGIDALLGDGKAPTSRQIVGLLVGFVGIVLLVSPDTRMAAGSRGFWSGFIATQLACIGWSTGSIYARKRARQHQDGHTLATVAFEMLFGGIVLVGCGLILGEKLGLAVTPRSASAFLYLIVFGSIVAYSCYRYALQHLPVATLSLYVYINTAIAVLLGVFLLAEPFNWRMGTGAAVVLLGIALVKEQHG